MKRKNVPYTLLELFLPLRPFYKKTANIRWTTFLHNKMALSSDEKNRRGS